MDFLATLDGNMKISETESACEIEQDGGFQLDSIQFGTVVKDGTVFLVNKAAFNEKLSGILKNLTIIEIKDNDDPKAVRKGKEDSGWSFICDSQIYVENFTKRVMVFGKTSF